MTEVSLLEVASRGRRHRPAVIGLAVGALAAALGVQPEKASQLLKGSAHLVGLSVLDVSRLLVTELDHGGTHR